MSIHRPIYMTTAIVMTVLLAVMVLSAQDDLDTVRLAADQGQAAAQLNLGNMYADGQGVLKDDAEAVRWYRLAAAQGIAAAQFNLGIVRQRRGCPQGRCRPYAGIGWPPTRDKPQHSSTSGICTPTGRVFSRTMPQP